MVFVLQSGAFGKVLAGNCCQLAASLSSSVCVVSQLSLEHLANLHLLCKPHPSVHMIAAVPHEPRQNEMLVAIL